MKMSCNRPLGRLRESLLPHKTRDHLRSNLTIKDQIHLHPAVFPCKVTGPRMNLNISAEKIQAHFIIKGQVHLHSAAFP
ncbi:hypothetical protein LDENG_00250850 [Lucifuga dentata]|nr:hypothetical protein LDENG_00250850 [Lucifuga dentata]